MTRLQGEVAYQLGRTARMNGLNRDPKEDISLSKMLYTLTKWEPENNLCDYWLNGWDIEKESV